ncbi:VOC family protein [Candidatus Saccharibacteria bacterium]|nr:VOC family protein [Candidatus Saccharibacteria bacterium]
MAVKLNTYLNFPGTTREAMEFYKSIFGGDVQSDTYGSYAGSMPVSEGDEDKIMHAVLTGDNGIELMAADTAQGMGEANADKVSLTLSGDDEALLRSYWDKLAEGGRVNEPLVKAPWGDTFGMLTDKFGVNWMVNITAAQQ